MCVPGAWRRPPRAASPARSPVREGWTREALEARVDELAARRDSFVPSIQRLSAVLDERERELLGRVLLERANREAVLGQGLAQPLERRSWVKRVWEGSERRSGRRQPPEESSARPDG